MTVSRYLVHRVGNAELVFGLDWYVVLGEDNRRAALGLARQHRARYWILCGDQMATVGLCTQIPASRPREPRYSAAHLLAQRYATGTVGMVLPVTPGLWWLIAIHEGIVIARSDDLYGSEHEAQERLLSLRSAYPTLRVLDATAHIAIDELVQLDLQAARLRPLAYFARQPLRPFFLAGMLVLAIALIAWRAYQSQAHVARLAKPHTQELHTAWEQAIRTAAASHWVHGIVGTQDVLEELHRLPVVLAGWQLVQAQCQAQFSRWDCFAQYQRREPTARNSGFLLSAHKDWIVEFNPLDVAQIRWSRQALGKDASQTALYDAQHSDGELFSRLQTIQPALASITIGSRTDLPVRAPLDPQGKAYGRPPSLSLYRLRSVHFKGPLRSLSVLLPDLDSFGWQHIRLQVGPIAVPGLKESRFSIQLQGVLYEKEA